MTDPRATRPRSAPSARRTRPDGPLGELEFADWYETPVFEPDDDERLEEMATTGHGPRRLMAKATIAREAHRAKRRPGWDDDVAEARAPKRQPATPAPAQARTAAPATAPEPVPTAVTPAPAKATPAPAAPAARTTPAPAAARTAAPAARPTPAPAATRTAAPAARPTPAPVATRTRAVEELAPTAPAPVKRSLDLDDLAGGSGAPHDRWSSWATSGPALDHESMQRDLNRENWRRRVNSFLDRWAESEVSVAARLDRSLEKVLDPSLPKSLPGLLAAARRGGSH